MRLKVNNIIKLLMLFIVMATIGKSETIRHTPDSVIYKPFGQYSHPQPPVRAQIVVASPSLSFSAQQVCGYTDWSTAAINLPKELLSATYWNGVGSSLKKQATDSLLAISGALPSMLACNASPTFCHVLNEAKRLAQAELSFTMDSCKMLDGLANNENLQNEPLRGCIQKKVSAGKTASQARELCITSGELNKTKDEKMNSVVKEGGSEEYNSEKLYNSACSQTRQAVYSTSSFAYSTSEKSCEWLKELFPGVVVGLRASMSTSGTFQPIAEKKYTDSVHETNVYMVQLLEIMHSVRYGTGSYSSKGPQPRENVINHSAVKSKLGLKNDGSLAALCVSGSGAKCVADASKIPPVYRLSGDGKTPTILIDPNMLYEIVEFVGKESTPQKEFEKKPSRLDLMLTRIAQSSSYIKTNDTLSDTLGRVIASCRTDPNLQSAAAQMDCEAKLSMIKAEQDSLSKRRETDNDFLASQAQFYAEVSRAKSETLKLDDKEISRTNRDEPKLPSAL